MKNRVISLLLVVCLIFSMVPFSVFAERLVVDVDSEVLSEQWLKYLAIQSEENEELLQWATTSDVGLSGSRFNDSGVMEDQWQKFLAEVAREESELSFFALEQMSDSSTALAFAPQSLGISRYTVLVIDVSGSMSGTPMAALKTAANKFCEAVLEADGNNYVAIVSYASGANIVRSFTNDLASLRSGINGLFASGLTNITAGLQLADNLLSAIPDEAGTIKNVLLFSDGLPNTGAFSYSGPYTSSDYGSYHHANATYHKATELKEKDYNIYTLGFFHGLWGSTLNFARRFMEDLQNRGYYDVVNAEDLEFVFGEIAENIIKRTGKFRYSSDVLKEGRDYEATYYYDDRYFFQSSYIYNSSLATMSMCLTMAAFASNEKDYPHKSDNARVLLEQIGFTDFRTNSWYRIKPTRDSIGVVAANKKIKVNSDTYTLIAVALRGAGYESEWASNFTLGKYGDHQGFNQAKDDVLSFLREYISEQGITGDIKLWITGFSRAGGTANLVAGALNRGATLGDCTLRHEDLYAYCFEPPQGSVLPDANRNLLYNNTFNIINANDPVPKVAPAPYGFRRYGRDRLLPAPQYDGDYTNKRIIMLEKYYALESITYSSDYVVDNFAMKKVSLKVERIPYTPMFVAVPAIVDDHSNALSQGVFLDFLVLTLALEQFKNRQNYVDEFQAHFRELFGVLRGTEGAQWKEFQDVFQAKLKANVGWLIASTNPLVALVIGDTASLVKQYAVESLHQANITDYNVSDIDSMAAAFAKVIISFAVSNPNYVATLISNGEGLGAAHYPELCLAWLQSMDKNYTTDAGLTFSVGAYRIIRINCPVDVEVYDGGGRLVASIVADVPREVENSSIIAAINEDGEKLVFLPADTSYNVRLLATGQGLMTYSINEFSTSDGAVTRVINYYDIAIEPGDVFNGFIPAYSAADIEKGFSDGTGTEYLLVDAGDELLAASADLAGAEAMEAYYMVYVVLENEKAGFVTGQGIRQVGSYAKVTAIAFDGYEFEGWYVEGEKVSAEQEYRFRVENDVEVVAGFTANRYPLTIVAGPGGRITAGTTGDYGTDTVINIAAAANAGYRFKNWTSSSNGSFANAGSAATSFTMPANAVTITANFELADTDYSSGDSGYTPIVVAAPRPRTGAAVTFDDIVGHWARAEIELLASMGIVSGVAPGKFAPEARLTRAQTAVLLVRTLELSGGTEGLSFKDVKPGDWYYSDVLLAARAGIIRGYGNGEFKPNQHVSRQEFAVMLMRALRYKDKDITLSDEDAGASLAGFSDSGTIAAWAANDVAKAVKLGLVGGFPGGMFVPGGEATRAQGTVMLVRMLRNLGTIE